MQNQKTTISSNHRIIIILCSIALILSIPLIAMQFTNEVNWTSSDFITAASLLLSTGLGIELIIRNFKSGLFRTIALILILVVLFLVWAELAVGIFGSPFAGN